MAVQISTEVGNSIAVSIFFPQLKETKILHKLSSF